MREIGRVRTVPFLLYNALISSPVANPAARRAGLSETEDSAASLNDEGPEPARVHRALLRDPSCSP